MRKPNDLPSFDALTEFLAYDPSTGKFTWVKVPPKHQRGKPGDTAGFIDASDGYVKIKFKGKRYKAHRLAFVFMQERIPDEVDHENGDRSDNRWENLRGVTHAINMRNTSKIRGSRHVPVTGVGWMPKRRKWRVRIAVGGSTQYLGLFDSLEAAIAARLAANPPLSSPSSRPSWGRSSISSAAQPPRRRPISPPTKFMTLSTLSRRSKTMSASWSMRDGLSHSVVRGTG